MGKLIFLITTFISINLTFASDHKVFDNLIKDPKNRVSDIFHVNDYFYHSTKFWLDIYTKHDSSTVVVHDKNRMDLVYDVVKFHSLKKNIKHHHTRYLKQNKIISDDVKAFKKALTNLAYDKNRKGKFEKRVIEILKDHKIKVPKGRSKKKNFYLTLKKNVRTQTGQKDKIQQGIKNYIPFKPTIDHYVKLFKVPKELVSIPFLESSFNIRARSKVGATGVWQFMPYISKVFMPKDKKNDGRLNPLMSSISALHLLKQNKKILMDWPSAVAAYNAGPKHFLKGKRKLGSKKAPLHKVLKTYKHPHLGFAARNFYSEFLALAYTLNYIDYFFPKEYKKMKKLNARFIKPYLTKCKLRPKVFYSKLENSSPMIKYFNYHQLKPKSYYGRGSIVFSDINLNKRKYQQIPDRLITGRYPINWKRAVKLQNCSVR